MPRPARGPRSVYVAAGPCTEGRIDRPCRTRHHEEMRASIARWIVLGGVLLAVGGFLLPGINERLEHQVRAHERLHYGLHLTAGRTLSVCPCTQSLALVQYGTARAHAHTSRQQMLVTTDIPRAPDERLEDAVLVSRLTLGVLARRPGGLVLLSGAALVLAALSGLLFRARPARG